MHTYLLLVLHKWDTTEGFFSRWAVVPFTAFFPAGVADPTLIARLTLRSELRGLLRAAVGGLQQVMRRGRFSQPASVVDATERFRIESDPMQGFIEDRVRFDTHARVHRSDLYNAYTGWAALNGFAPMSAQRFYEEFTRAAISISNTPVAMVKRDGERVFNGVVLK